MEYVVILLTLWIVLYGLKILFGYNLKKIEKSIKNEELDKFVEKYPNNEEICKYYLKKLNNESVIIEENEGTENSLYIAIFNKILIGNIKKSYSRIQTIAHECLHSIQDKKLLIFNFIYSNIYILFFVIITILAICKLLPYKLMFVCLLMFMGLVYYMIRTFLENDAMIKARYLAKEYMEEKKISSEEEIKKIVDGFDKINNIGIKCVNYNIFFNVTMITIVFSLVCLLT